jgi:hypothetical protein
MSRACCVASRAVCIGIFATRVRRGAASVMPTTIPSLTTDTVRRVYLETAT